MRARRDDGSCGPTLLQDTNRTERTRSDFAACGVGEETNVRVGSVAASSRRLEEPLATVLQSRLAAGEPSLWDAILSLTPEESPVKYSALVGKEG